METVQCNAPPQIVEIASDPKPVLSLPAPTASSGAGLKHEAAMAGHGVASADQDRKEGGESFGYSEESSDSSSSASIDDTHLHQKISRHFSMRDSLLSEAWERKKERALQDNVAGLREHFISLALGRSSSDCGNVKLRTKSHPLYRNASDVGKDCSPTAARAPAHSVTDDDLQELKGCIDLGFCFDESSLPAFSHTLPALEMYCAVAQSLQESPYGPSPTASPKGVSSSAASTSLWRVCRPGDAPEDVKGRLRHWAQAVACNAKLC